jgi:hypothetical protein
MPPYTMPRHLINIRNLGRFGTESNGIICALQGPVFHIFQIYDASTDNVNAFSAFTDCGYFTIPCDQVLLASPTGEVLGQCIGTPVLSSADRRRLLARP